MYNIHTHTHAHTIQFYRPNMSVSVSSEVQYMTSSSQLSTRLVEVFTTDSHLLTGWVTSLLASWLTCPQHRLSWLAVRLTDTLVNSLSAADAVYMDSLGVVFSSSARIQKSTKEANNRHLDVEIQIHCDFRIYDEHCVCLGGKNVKNIFNIW